jgi:[ribosomal protein S18]-alanine N-acetyltransferase
VTGSAETAAVLVRMALPADAANLAAIHACCFARAWDEAAMAQFLGVPGCLALIASTSEHAPAQGFLIARAASDEAELLTLSVLPADRRQGLARALLAALVRELRRSGGKRLFLEVEDRNEAALGLYRSLGAEAVGRRPGYYEHGADAAIFSLAL